MSARLHLAFFAIRLLVLSAALMWASELPVLAQTTDNVTVEQLAERLAELESSPKDFWDKVEASGAVIAGVLVATIGAIATVTYNLRQQNLQRAQTERHQSISRIQVIGELLPQLSSDDRSREAALVAVGVLDFELAEKLARIYQNEGGLGALERLSRSDDEAISQPATASLRDVRDRLARSVVTLALEDGSPVGSGFFQGPGNRIITTSYIVDAARDGALYVRDQDGSTMEGRVDNRSNDLASLSVESPGVGLPLGSSQDLQIDDRVDTLSFAGGMRSGTIIGYDSDGLLRIGGMSTEPGSGGAPIVDRSGRVVAVHYKVNTTTAEGFAVPVEKVRALLGEASP